MKKNKAEVGSDTMSFGLILALLDNLADAVYERLVNGFFGKIFTAYSREQAMFDQGFLKNHFTGGTGLRFFFRKIRQYLSGTFENSFFIRTIGKWLRGFLAVPLKSIGNFFFAFGAYTVLIYFIRWLVPDLAATDIGVAIVGAVICIVSIPMLLSEDNLAVAVGKSVILRFLFMEVFGFREESFQVATKNSRIQSNLLLMAGMALGVLTLALSPLWILFGIIAAVGIALIFASPEIGLILALFFCPFFSFLENPAFSLGILILVVLSSYLLKIIRGKRILKMELLDFFVLLFGVILYFSGAITAGGKTGFYETLLSCELLCGYFLVVNLMRTEKWLKRCVAVWVTSGTIVAVFGILQYVFGMTATGSWLDISYFSDIRGRTTSVFDNPNVLAFYLILILPFSLLAWVRAEGRKPKIISAFSIVSILLCLVLTWSRGAWLAAIFCLLLFALIRSKKTIRFLFFLCLFLPFLSFILPQSVTKRFMSIGDLSDSSTMYRVYTWKGTLRVIKEYFVGGIGYGTTAYREIYPQYAYAGIEAAEHSHNLFLQILLGMGIGGLLIFLAILLFSAQMNFEYLKKSADADNKLRVSAAMCAIFSFMLMGLFDFTWYNYRVFFLFWCVLAFACACIRVGNEEERRHGVAVFAEQNSATLDINW